MSLQTAIIENMISSGKMEPPHTIIRDIRYIINNFSFSERANDKFTDACVQGDFSNAVYYLKNYHRCFSYNYSPVTIKPSDITSVCGRGSIEFVDWIIEKYILQQLSITPPPQTPPQEEIENKMSYCFEFACQHGNLPVARWISQNYYFLNLPFDKSLVVTSDYNIFKWLVANCNTHEISEETLSDIFYMHVKKNNIDIVDDILQIWSDHRQTFESSIKQSEFNLVRHLIQSNHLHMVHKLLRYYGANRFTTEMSPTTWWNGQIQTIVNCL